MFNVVGYTFLDVDGEINKVQINNILKVISYAEAIRVFERIKSTTSNMTGYLFTLKEEED